MSLFDALIRDALLDTVMQSDVYIAFRSDDAPGSGTEKDPYNGKDATKFDDVLKNKIPAGTTIHLGPGTFSTTGSPTWQPKDRWRIVGAGIDATTLKLVSAPQDSFTSVIGPSTTFLDGFEASDFTIDCNLNGQAPGPNHSRSVGGIAVSGKNIFLRRIRVINFGNAKNGSATANKCYALSAAWATTTSPAGKLPYNCLIENCEVTSPQGQVDQPVICLHLGTDGSSSSYLHTGCVIRNCWVDLGLSSAGDFVLDYRAICACGGKGTIVEGNRVYNCTSAGPHNDSAETALPTTDLVVRENYSYNVKYGINVSATGGALGRVVIENNVVELTQAVSDPKGISLVSSAGSSPVFTQVIARGNCIRPADGVTPSNSTWGIELSRASQAVIESNLISVADVNKAVTHANCGSVKCFDNQSPQGVVLRGYDSTTSMHDAELTTDVEDALLNL